MAYITTLQQRTMHVLDVRLHKLVLHLHIDPRCSAECGKSSCVFGCGQAHHREVLSSRSSAQVCSCAPSALPRTTKVRPPR